MSSAAFNNRRPRPGRPRLIPESTTQSAREQILEACGGLFVSQGFANTSTREIAEHVGIRQASLYYHFEGGKGEILAELLEMSVRPALETLDQLGDLESDEASLYTLAYHDAETLAGLMCNIGVLPGLPDVARTPECREYEIARRELRQAYGSLAISCASDVVIRTIDKNQLAGLILENVESVISSRADGDVVKKKNLHAVAATCLRICGVPDDQIEAAASAFRTRVL